MIKAIDIQQLHVSYSGNEVLQDINLSIDTGKLVGIIGPNGAGKSTLIKAILGLVPIDKGKIKINNENLNKVRKDIAYVPQRSDIDWDFPILVKDSVLIGTYPKLGLFRRPTKKEKDLAMESLVKVGMEEYAKKQISELSGGEQQRVFIARALAQEAEFFFLDEPFAGVDVASEDIIINILRELRDKGKTVFVIHHDLMKVKSYFDELILINKKLIGVGPVDLIFRPEYMHVAYQDPLFMLDILEVGK
ncbi:MAG TPA: metal ABC transporter ATP-binding protein [Tissierellaceae bacterium]|nr:metal ABC transporter ATP-binding protein [Tissierellaceae bacterium]